MKLKYSLLLFMGCLLVAACDNDQDTTVNDTSGNSSSLMQRPTIPRNQYDSANQVASRDLVAYWPLNGTGTELKSGTNPTSFVNATYVNGVKGQGLKLTNGFLAYPSISGLSASLPSMSLSLWAKVTNNQDTANHPTMLFSLARFGPGEWAGNINLFAETGQRPSTRDTLTMRGLVVIKSTDGTENYQDVINSVNPSPDDIAAGHTGNANLHAGEWAQYIITWEAATGTFRLYANGQKISDQAYEIRNGGFPLDLNFFTPTVPIIGAFATVLTGNPEPWQASADAELDEIRVYKKALSTLEISRLYQLESTGH